MRVSVNLNAQKPDTTTNAVIYARYSSHGQTEQSIEGQLAKGHEYAAAQGYTVVHEYIDRAMTGRNDNREAFQKMLSDTGKHQFQVVIVWKVDRFGRNREEIAFNKHTCKKNGVRVEYVAESLPNSPEAVILESVLEGMAEYYSIQLSQNIRRGQLESAKKCQCVGGSVPLGYTLDSDKHFVIDPQTAPVVKKIFDLYAEGATISEITGQLNEQGIRTARKQLFTKNSLTKLLKNEKYIGVYTYKDIVRVEGGVPAIVDESTFDRVQELLKINRRAPSHTWTKVEYLLTDKLFCGHCGSPMVGESGFSHTGAKYSYYGCIKRRREKACDKKPVRQDWIEALVLDETVKLLHDDELMEYIIDRTWEYYQVTDKVQEEKAVLEAQLAEVDKAINNLVRAIEAGIFNAATKSRMDELDAQKAALTASLADLELTSGIRITRDHIEYFLLRLRDLDVKDRECQKRLVQTFVNAVFIYDDGRVKITYNYSGQSSTITLNQIASAEKGKGFVCCLPCSQLYQRRTARKNAIRDGLQAVHIPNTLQRLTPTERILPDALQLVHVPQPHQRCAPVKRMVANLRQPGRQLNLLQIRAARKGVIADFRHAIGNLHALKARVARKGVVLNPLHPRRNRVCRRIPAALPVRILRQCGNHQAAARQKPGQRKGQQFLSLHNCQLLSVFPLYNTCVICQSFFILSARFSRVFSPPKPLHKFPA